MTKTATQAITVNPYVQPTSITINMNYEWLGSSNGSNLAKANLPVVKSDDHVTTTITEGSSNQPRGDADYIHVLKEITGGYIPANTGVVVYSATAKTYTANITTTGATLGETNILKPWVTVGTPSDATYYTLAAGPTFKKSSGGILAAGKAYLVLPTSAPELNVIIDGTTGINAIQKQAENGEFYNLAGQRVAQPTKGLYIVNGKKYMVK